MTGTGDHPCILCGASEVVALPDQPLFPGVTSDCKPWPKMGTLGHCHMCGHLQKIIDTQWFGDMEAIYDQYTLYHLSQGLEQVVFQGGTPRFRSDYLLKGFISSLSLPDIGSALDFGCGVGATLKTLRHQLPGWSLAGYERSGTTRVALEAMLKTELGGAAFFDGSLSAIKGEYDVITMFAVVEHLINPVEDMAQVARLLLPGGKLLLQTANIETHLFDLVVVDHCSFFSKETLVSALRRAGLRPLSISCSMISKEFSVIAERAPEGPVICDKVSGLDGIASRNLRWLQAVRESANALAQTPPFGIVGSANAGNWLGATMGKQVGFYIDEDPHRQGRDNFGAPTLLPEEAPQGGVAYLAFTPAVARSLRKRMESRAPSVTFIEPPAEEPVL